MIFIFLFHLQRIATTVSLTDEAPPYLEISYQVDETTCTTPATVKSKSICADVALNRTIEFDVDVKLKFCPNPLPKDPKYVNFVVESKVGL